jgi:formylglycine-generating enzyme required for sulfatase activity
MNRGLRPRRKAWCGCPGGEFLDGCALHPWTRTTWLGMRATTDSRPIHRVSVDGFWMDANEVTNEQFARFVKETPVQSRWRSEHRRRRITHGGAGRFEARVPWCSLRPITPYRSMITYQWWAWIDEASWRHPAGAVVRSRVRRRYPVVQSPTRTREAICEVGGKTTADRSASGNSRRAALSGASLPVGQRLQRERPVDGQQHEGIFPNIDTRDDAYVGIAPVAQYPPNALRALRRRPATSGSGRPTGIARTTTLSSRRAGPSRAIRRAH